MSNPHPIQEICAALTQQGYPDLARRIAYFASDEDLEEGEAPVTLESLLGFWEFFSAVIPDGSLERLDLACSPEGCISAYWDFPDTRRVAVWFPDTRQVNFVVMDGDGKFVRVDGANSCSPSTLLEKLVEESWFIWRPGPPEEKNLSRGTTSPVTAADDI